MELTLPKALIFSGLFGLLIFGGGFAHIQNEARIEACESGEVETEAEPDKPKPVYTYEIDTSERECKPMPGQSYHVYGIGNVFVKVVTDLKIEYSSKEDKHGNTSFTNTGITSPETFCTNATLLKKITTIE